MSSEAKHVPCAVMVAPHSSLIIESVAGSGYEGFLDGPLRTGEFKDPYGLCRFGDSLIVVDSDAHTIRQVTGVLGVVEPLPMEDKDIGIGPADFEAHAASLLMTAIQVIPKELGRLIAQYAVPNGRITTLAGVPDKSGHVDGRALGASLFHRLTCVAVDGSDPMAGPRLIIGESRCVRSLTIRTQMVTTIAGSTRREDGHVDGLGHDVRFSCICAMAVAPNGTIYVSDIATDLVRRISSSPEHTVTTLIGHSSGRYARFTQNAASSAECFRQPLRFPWTMAVHASDAERDQSGDADRDVGVLYVGCHNGVHAFDLTRGERKCYALIHFSGGVAGLALTEDGVRLFAVTPNTVQMINTHTGACTTLLVHPSVGQFRAGSVTDKEETTARFGFAMGCVIDKATSSLLMVDSTAKMLIRLRGVDV